jgi:hypothetical protein
MNYFQPYPLRVDDDVTKAWQSQISEAAKSPWLARVLAERAGELFPRFAANYVQLRALPRSLLSRVQGQLARRGDLATIYATRPTRSERRNLQRKLAYTLAGAALRLALGQTVAQAATINVSPKTPRLSPIAAFRTTKGLQLPIVESFTVAG